MQITSKLHREVFEELYGWSERAKDQNLINPFFATRFRRDQKFRDGLYFQGNESYLAITFWTGSDYINKTPNLYFEINPNLGLKAWMIGRDSELKSQYFKSLSDELDGWKEGSYPGTYVKKYSENSEDWKLYLSKFVEEDKVIIDQKLMDTIERASEEDDNFLNEEYISKFGFISQHQFDEMIARTLEDIKTRDREIKVKKIKALSKRDKSFEELPIALESLSISKFHQLADAELESLPTNNNWIFITGQNGFGKTSILQALALGLTNHKRNGEYLDNAVSIKVGFIYESRNYINANTLYNSSEFKALNKFVVGYGPSRLNTFSAETRNSEVENQNNVLSLFSTTTRLKSLDYELARAQRSNKDYFKSLVKLIKECTDGEIQAVKVEKDLDVLYKISSGGKIWMPIEKISAGYRNILNIVGDIIIRLFDREQHKESTDIKGIVLIDEIENHLHPKLQKKLPELLSKNFPQVQFIATTHSPIPLLGTNTKSIILNVFEDHNKALGIRRLENLEEYLPKLLPNAIYTSDIFDLEDLISRGLEDPSEASTADSMDEVSLEERLKKQLNILKNNDDDLLNLFGNEKS